jgi:purine nucleoside phosphorylase
MQQIDIGPKVQVGEGEDKTPKLLEQVNFIRAITIIGNPARVPANACGGRNRRIDPGAAMDDFDHLDVPSGGTLSRRE